LLLGVNKFLDFPLGGRLPVGVGGGTTGGEADEAKQEGKQESNNELAAEAKRRLEPERQRVERRMFHRKKRCKFGDNLEVETGGKQAAKCTGMGHLDRVAMYHAYAMLVPCLRHA
jgi:hypothetical protein